MTEYVYHERQVGSLCGVHCLNSALQGSFFGPGDLAEIALSLDEQERELFRTEGSGQENYDSSADGGNFSIQVLSVALDRFGINLVPSLHPDAKHLMQKPEECQGFVLNQARHWFCIRAVGPLWWNLNSTLDTPVLIGPVHLQAFLSQLQSEGYSAFIIMGRLPAPDGDDQHHDDSNWHHVSDVLPPESLGSPDVTQKEQEEMWTLHSFGFSDEQIRVARILTGGAFNDLVAALTTAGEVQVSLQSLERESTDLVTTDNPGWGLLRILVIAQAGSVDCPDIVILRVLQKRYNQEWDAPIMRTFQIVTDVLCATNPFQLEDVDPRDGAGSMFSLQSEQYV